MTIATATINIITLLLLLLVLVPPLKTNYYYYYKEIERRDNILALYNFIYCF